MSAKCHTVLRRLGMSLLILSLLVPALPRPAEAAAGHVVFTWTSPTYGFTIDYRRDSFVLEREETDGATDRLELRSAAGNLTVEAMPASHASDGCPARPTPPGQDGDTTRRVDCIVAPEGGYVVRFTHTAQTARFGRFESAARAVRESYLPSPLAGLIEPALVGIEESVSPPADSNLVNHPTRFFLVDIEFSNLSAGDSVIDASRVVIPSVSGALEFEWIDGEQSRAEELFTIWEGRSVTGRFLFAVPQSQSSFTLCYQHLTNGDCSFIVSHRFSGDTPSSDYQPRINPGR